MGIRFIKTSILNILLFFKVSLIAQTNVIIDMNDRSKCGYNDITQFSIKPLAFTDGDYVFFTDSLKKIIKFEGSINKGMTNGTYYTYSLNAIGNPIFESKNNIKVINGKINGGCIISCQIYNNILNRYYLKFLNDKLVKFEISNPFFNFNHTSEAAQHNPDTLIFNFNNGKLETINNYICNHKFNIPKKITAHNLKDTAGTKFLWAKNRYYIPNGRKIRKDSNFGENNALRGFKEIYDSVLICSHKEYHFEHTRILVQFDSTKKVTQILISTLFPKAVFEKDVELSPFHDIQLQFDRNEFITGIYFISAVNDVINGPDENGAIIQNLALDFHHLTFLTNGIIYCE